MKRVVIIALLLGLAMGGAVKRTPASIPAPQFAGDPLDLLPDGMGAAIINVKQVVGSDLWTMVMGSNKAMRAINRIESELGAIGLKLADLGGIAVSIPPPSTDSAVAVVSGSFNPGDMVAKLRGNSAVTLTSEKYKGIDVYRAVSTSGTKKSDVSFAFLDNSTGIVGSASGVHAAVDVHSGDKPSMSKNSNIESAMSQNPPAAIRFALVPPNGSLGSIQSEKVPLPDFSSVSLIFGTVGVSSEIDINATLRNDTPDHAKAMANQLNGLLSMAKGFLGSSNPKTAPIAEALKTVTISDAGGDVKISATLSREVVSQLIH